MAKVAPLGGMDDYLEIDLRTYIKVLQKWRFLIVGLTLLAMLTSGIISYFLIPPLYEARAVLLVTQQRTQRTSPNTTEQTINDVIDAVSRLPEMTINTYVGQATAPAVLERVIKKLNLNPDLYTVSTLANMITVSAAKDTNLINIDVRNTDPELAARIANTLSEEYLAFINENSQNQMAKSLKFLEEQREKVRADLAKAIASLKDFDSKGKSLDLLTSELNKRMEELTEYQSQLNQATVQIQELRAAKDALEERLAATPQKITLPQVGIAGNENQPAGIGQATEQVNPVYAQLAQELALKEAALAEAEARRNSLQKLIADVTKALESMQVEYTNKKAARDMLEREVKQLEEASSVLAQKVTEATIAKSINLGDTSLLLVSPARVPTAPIKPNKKLNIAVAGVLGLMVSVFLAFLLEYLDNTVKDPQQLETLLGLPVLATVPEIKRKRV